MSQTSDRKLWLMQDWSGSIFPVKPALHEPLLPTVTGIIAARGYDTPEAIAAFLSPTLSSMLDPFLLRGMDQAVERLVTARRSSQSICVYGDYDVDGITGTALLVSFLRAIGCRCNYFIPNRFDDGYGLNACLLYTSPSPRDGLLSRMPSSA